ncbi:MAG: energy transducer TonB [Polyangiaceae bacterium]|nr:energy transducer TonB [Polyangiaceae bacterium]
MSPRSDMCDAPAQEAALGVDTAAAGDGAAFALTAPAEAPGPDVLAPVRRLGVKTTRVGLVIGILGALLTHGSASARAAVSHLEILASAEQMRGAMKDFVKQFDIDLDEEKKPPAPKEEELPPPPPPEPTAPEPPPPPTNVPPPPPKDIYDEPKDRPAAAAADAPKILTAADDSPYADMTDEMVSGEGEGTFGYVTPGGTGTAPTYDPNARKDGVPGGTGKGPAPAPAPAPKVNRSRAADLVGSRSWSCPFPPEADAEQINRATATVVVTVSASGGASAARIVNDPGYGFGRAAQQCAMARRYSPALDADGQPITSTTPPINVTFRR